MQNAPWIKTINEDSKELTPELEDMYKKMAGPTGTLDNVLKIHSLHPKSLRIHWDFYTMVMRGSSKLSLVQREMVAVAVSSTNRCHY